MSAATLFRFCVSGFAIWIASPILSIVDTAVVGWGSTTELAALGPATALSDSSAYLFTFISVATTSLVARALALRRQSDVQQATREALTIALVLGTFLGAVLFVFGAPLLRVWTGDSGASAALVGPALTYVRIRALGMPAAFLTMVSQSAFLAAKQPSVPLLTIALAAVTNLGGDLLLCCVLGQGLAGAAWATVASQMVAAAIILRRLQQPFELGAFPLLASIPSLLPSRASLLRFASIGAPVSVLIAIKIALISVGLGGAAVSFSPASSAAHACLMSVYILAATLGDSISQAAQTFLPATLGRPAAAAALARALLLTATGVGMFNAAWAGIIPAFFPQVFTSSAEVGALMATVAPFMCVALLFHSSAMGTEGLLLAGRDLRWLVISYVRNAALCLISLRLIMTAGWGLTGVWLVLLQFHCTRLGQNSWRLFVSKGSPLLSAPLPAHASDN